jgi:hypothetical protein
MRSLIGGSLVLTLAVVAGGCHSKDNKTSPSTPATDMSKSVDTKTCTMQSGGKNVLSVTAGKDITCTPKDGQLTLKGHGNQLDIWLIPGAKTVEDGVAKVPDQIKSEFKDFKAKHSMDMMFAGNPGKHLSGTGVEADDNDPGNAEVVVFKAGDNVFVSCVHGEHIPADAPGWMMMVLGTAKAP